MVQSGKLLCYWPISSEVPRQTWATHCQAQSQTQNQTGAQIVKGGVLSRPRPEPSARTCHVTSRSEAWTTSARVPVRLPDPPRAFLAFPTFSSFPTCPSTSVRVLRHYTLSRSLPYAVESTRARYVSVVDVGNAFPTFPTFPSTPGVTVRSPTSPGLPGSHRSSYVALYGVRGSVRIRIRRPGEPGVRIDASTYPGSRDNPSTDPGSRDDP